MTLVVLTQTHGLAYTQSKIAVTHKKLLTYKPKKGIIKARKGKPFNGRPKLKLLKKVIATLVEGGYFFIDSIRVSNRIIKMIISTYSICVTSLHSHISIHLYVMK